MAGLPFEILAVNMAEDEATIRDFLTTIRLDFPILLDREGAALKRSNVFAFLTSYVVDRDGLLRSGVFGAIDWQDAAVLKALTALARGPAGVAGR